MNESTKTKYYDNNNLTNIQPASDQWGLVLESCYPYLKTFLYSKVHTNANR